MTGAPCCRPTRPTVWCWPADRTRVPPLTAGSPRRWPRPARCSGYAVGDSRGGTGAAGRPLRHPAARSPAPGTGSLHRVSRLSRSIRPGSGPAVHRRTRSPAGSPSRPLAPTFVSRSPRSAPSRWTSTARQHTLVATAGQDGRLNLSFTDQTNGRQTAPLAGGQHLHPDRKGFAGCRFQPDGESAVRLHRVRHLPGTGRRERSPGRGHGRRAGAEPGHRARLSGCMQHEIHAPSP